jgi:hypothetical protein
VERLPDAKSTVRLRTLLKGGTITVGVLLWVAVIVGGLLGPWVSGVSFAHKITGLPWPFTVSAGMAIVAVFYFVLFFLPAVIPVRALFGPPSTHTYSTRRLRAAFSLLCLGINSLATTVSYPSHQSAISLIPPTAIFCIWWHQIVRAWLYGADPGPGWFQRLMQKPIHLRPPLDQSREPLPAQLMKLITRLSSEDSSTWRLALWRSGTGDRRGLGHWFCGRPSDHPHNRRTGQGLRQV